MKKRLPKWFRDAFNGLQIDSWPEVCFGAPRISGHRLTAEFIAGRFAAGDDLDHMARDYNVHRSSLEDCLRFVLRVSELRPLEMDDFKQERINGRRP